MCRIIDERRLLAKLEEEDDWTDLLFLRLLIEAKLNKITRLLALLINLRNYWNYLCLLENNEQNRAVPQSAIGKLDNYVRSNVK